MSLRPPLPSPASHLIGLRAFHLRPTIASRLRLRPCSAAPTGPVELEWNDRQRFKQRTISLPFWRQHNSNYGRFAYQHFSSDDESDVEFASPRSPPHQQLGDSTLENIDEWRWKLTMLLRNNDEQEVVSREKKDRRDYEQLSALATRMGLYSRQYARVIVFSKTPLPNYRPDLDDKRPQREVILPFGVHREVDTHLRAHLSQKPTKKLGSFDDSLHRSSDAGSIHSSDRIYEKPVSMIHNSVVKEKILRRRSLELRNKQEDWQESPEGQRMLEFRRSLPAFKEKDAFLKAISDNQV
ncbi:hypothetical protein PIB30_082018, partial [Stylosanthes scabra]|nr:hypothetical protein [Stylosanthes scabra]